MPKKRQGGHESIFILAVIMLLMMTSLGWLGQYHQQEDLTIPIKNNMIHSRIQHDNKNNNYHNKFPTQVVPSMSKNQATLQVPSAPWEEGQYHQRHEAISDSSSHAYHPNSGLIGQQASNYLFNASLDRTIYGSGSTLHVTGFLGFINGTPIAGNEINITIYDNFDQKISSLTTNSLTDGTWTADYQLSVTIPSGGYYINASTVVNSTRLVLQVNFMVVSQSSISINSLTTHPNPPVLGFPTSVVVELSSSDVESVKVIYTPDNGSTWNQTSLYNSLDRPSTFTAVIGTFYKNVTIQWFVMVIDIDGKIKESSIQNITFQSFQVSLTIDRPQETLTHETYLINASITTNIPDEYYYLETKATKGITSERLTTWKIGPHKYQLSFSTSVEGRWMFIFNMLSAFNNSVIFTMDYTITFSLKDLHPPLITSITYDENLLLENRPIEVSIVVEENQTYRELQVTLRYRKGTIDEGFTTAWTTVTLLERGQSSLTTVTLTWEVPFVLQEGDMIQFQVIATDGFGNTAQTRLYTISYPLTREETSNLPSFIILLTMISLTIAKKKHGSRAKGKIMIGKW